MIVGSIAHEVKAVVGQFLGECFRVRNHLLLVFSEVGLGCLEKTDSLGRNDVHQRSSLRAWENCGVNSFGKFFSAEYQTASGASQGLVGGGGYEVCMRNR